MPTDNEAKGADLERELLGVGLRKPDRNTERHCLAPRLGQHRGREVDTRDLMTARGKLETEKAGTAARIERLEHASPSEDKIKGAVPSGALGRRADAVAEALIEVRCPPIPMGRDPLLDDVSSADRHAIPRR